MNLNSLTVNKLDVATIADWWSSASEHEQRAYIQLHPRSKYAKMIKSDASKPDVPKEIKPIKKVKATASDFKDYGFKNLSKKGQMEVLHDWNAIFDIKPHELISNMFDAEDKPIVHIHPVTRRWNDTVKTHAKVKIHISCKDFHMNRIFSKNLKTGELCIHHASFEVESESQNKGIAKKYLSRHFAMYKKMGVKRVSLTANCDVGAYAWAKYGFTPTLESWKTLQDSMNDRFFRNSLVDISNPELKDLASEELRKICKDNNPKAIWNLANLTMPAMSKRQYSSIKFNTTLGKAMLLGYDWDGQIDLDDKEAMDKFNAYVGSGEEK